MTNSTNFESAREPTPDQRFWQLWRQGQQPDLLAYLASLPELSSRTVAEIVAIDQYERWTAGDRVPAEKYLSLLPADSDYAHAVCDVVYGEYLLRKQLGEKPSTKEYLERFPLVRESLSRQFSLHQALAEHPEETDLPSPTIHELTVPGRRLFRQKLATFPVIPGYEILSEIGKGGMGVVYKAQQLSLQRTVALKVVTPPSSTDSDSLERMRREARITAHLSHPNIVTVFDAGVLDSTFYLAMEYVKGIDLHRLVEKIGPLSIDLVREYLRQAALGLRHAAEKGLVHRDIKPSNLMVTQPTDGSPGILKILDLGLARVQSSQSESELAPLTQLGAFMGTPDYVAPEQAADPRTADARADLYSLGCTMYYLLTGQTPFGGATPLAKLVQHHLQDPLPVESLRPDVPADLAYLVRRLMAKRPEDRFQSADELLRYLDRDRVNTRSYCRAKLVQKLVGPTERLRAIAFGPLCQRLAAACHDGSAYLWQVGAWDTTPVRLESESGGLSCLTFLADGLGLVIGSELGVLERWDLHTRTVRWRMNAHPGCINTIAVSVNGKQLLSGGHDGSLRLWEAASGQLISSWMAHTGSVWGVGFLSQDCLALSGGQDRALRLWEISRGESVALFPEQPMHVTALAVSPDGRQALSGGIDGTLYYWDTTSRKLLATFEGHEGRVTSISFSPDGSRAVTASRDLTIHLWDLQNREKLDVLREHQRWITAVAWSADGRFIASAGYDRLVCVWEL